MRTVLEILQLSSDYLQQRGVEHARRQAEELLAEALGLKRMELYLQHDRPLNDQELDRCRAWLKRRGLREPLAYISGVHDFFDCRFAVDKRVLIPRQETEILADRVAKVLGGVDVEGKVLWDICCGSGCLGIALKKRFPKLHVALADVSLDALEVARTNASNNAVDVEILHGDLLAPFALRTCDFLLCNPPYIAEGEYAALEPEVRSFEPKVALVGGGDGLLFYRRLADSLLPHLNRSARAWFEIGAGQGEQVKALFQGYPLTSCLVACDWAGHERFFSLEIE